MSLTVPKIAIVDYGMGNLRSVAQALMHASPQAQVTIARSKQEIEEADRLVLPGQGAMPDCMLHLRESGLLDALLLAVKSKPLLGVCVGEQMLFDCSDEKREGQAEPTPGLGVMSGRVVRFQLEHQTQPDGSHYKVPHMGWNQVKQSQAHALWTDIPDESSFYFVHSYYVIPSDEKHTVGMTDYGGEFTCAVAYDNVFATQFHPEKSAKLGLQLYKNFTTWQP